MTSSPLQKTQFVHLFLMTIIIVIAIIFRTLNIETAPPGLYPNEANNATNAYTAATTGNFEWFYTDNRGREGLYINVMAVGFKIFGVSTLTIKLPSIIFGLLTVLGIYFLGRELFPSKPRIALIAAYLSTISFWLVNFSRIGFRAIAMLPVLCFMFYFLFRGIRTGKFYNYIIAGVICGLGFHTYIAFRIVPILLLVLIILFLLIDTSFIKRYYRGILGFVLSTAIVMLPLILTFWEQPEYFSTRTEDVSIFSPDNRPDNLGLTVLKTVSLSLIKFNLFGDPNWRHGFPPFAMLEPLTGLAFLSGLCLMIGLFFRTLYLRLRRNIRNRNLVVSGLLLAWFGLFLIPEVLTIEGLPHALRSIGTIPPVFLFAAYALNAFIEKREKHHHTQDHLHMLSDYVQKAALVIFFLYIGVFGFMKYHVFWAQHPETAIAFNTELREIAYALQRDPQTPAKIVLGPLERLPVDIYTLKNSNIIYLYPEQIDTLTLEKNEIIYATKNAKQVAAALESRYNQKQIISTYISTSHGTGYHTFTRQ